MAAKIVRQDYFCLPFSLVRPGFDVAGRWDWDMAGKVKRESPLM